MLYNSLSALIQGNHKHFVSLFSSFAGGKRSKVKKFHSIQIPVSKSNIAAATHLIWKNLSKRAIHYAPVTSDGFLLLLNSQNLLCSSEAYQYCVPNLAWNAGNVAFLLPWIPQLMFAPWTELLRQYHYLWSWNLYNHQQKLLGGHCPPPKKSSQKWHLNKYGYKTKQNWWLSHT